MANISATDIFSAPAEIKYTTDPSNLNELLEKEWLLTNQRGSYSSGTVIGCNTRRYHGLLVASMHPPVERVVTLSNMLETATLNGQSYELANFEFSDRVHPQGYRFCREFRRDNGVHFRYEFGPSDNAVIMEKSIYLSYDEDLLIISYNFINLPSQIDLDLMPLVALRDFHSLQKSSASLDVDIVDNVVTARTLDPHGPSVHIFCPQAQFNRGPDWWYSMRYHKEAQRGQYDYEDVWAPGHFAVTVSLPGRINLLVRAVGAMERPGPLDFDVDKAIMSIRNHQKELLASTAATKPVDKLLVKAADNFIVRRQITETQLSTSILAGYHWFADWGRDTFISLPGLLLCTGRFAEAREVLLTFGTVLDGGQIPNRFDDYGGPAHYNSVDASLWYINAAYQYYKTTNDSDTFYDTLRPAMAEILHAYKNGTRDNIHADSDMLITAGDENTQLTWMDARCNGVSFTPRYGKPVEVNALWISALHIMTETAQDNNDKAMYVAILDKAVDSFNRLFWNADNGSLYDCILPDGTPDAAIRPNQIFAVSLPFSCVDIERQKSIVEVVRSHLLTPYGLRSLSPKDSRYQGCYQGDQFQRDSAYHQGTVWGFLTGPYIEAFLKVNNFSTEACEQAVKMIEPLLDHMRTDACLGNISEIFDGDYPHHPKGCVAQAWSVAELIRCRWLLSHRGN